MFTKNIGFSYIIQILAGSHIYINIHLCIHAYAHAHNWCKMLRYILNDKNIHMNMYRIQCIPISILKAYHISTFKCSKSLPTHSRITLNAFTSTCFMHYGEYFPPIESLYLKQWLTWYNSILPLNIWCQDLQGVFAETENIAA